MPKPPCVIFSGAISLGAMPDHAFGGAHLDFINGDSRSPSCPGECGLKLGVRGSFYQNRQTGCQELFNSGEL